MGCVVSSLTRSNDVKRIYEVDYRAMELLLAHARLHRKLKLEAVRVVRIRRSPLAGRRMNELNPTGRLLLPLPSISCLNKSPCDEMNLNLNLSCLNNGRPGPRNRDIPACCPCTHVGYPSCGEVVAWCPHAQSQATPLSPKLHH